jgi:hypothetical protein
MPLGAGWQVNAFVEGTGKPSVARDAAGKRQSPSNRAISPSSSLCQQYSTGTLRLTMPRVTGDFESSKIEWDDEQIRGRIVEQMAGIQVRCVGASRHGLESRGSCRCTAFSGSTPIIWNDTIFLNVAIELSAVDRKQAGVAWVVEGEQDRQQAENILALAGHRR